MTKALRAAGEESARQSVSLFIWNQTSALMAGKLFSSAGRTAAIRVALSPPCSALAVSEMMIGFPFAASPL